MIDENQEAEKKVEDKKPAEGEQRQRSYRRRRWKRPSSQSSGQQSTDNRPPQQPKFTEFISVVIPLYNEQDSLRELFNKVKYSLQSLTQKFEIIFIDDGSNDNSLKILRDLRGNDNRIKIISFRRNYGKSAALSVGFQNSKGDIIITMDADLQDDPSEIGNLVNEIKKGRDLVSGWKKKRYDPISKTIPSKLFNFVTSKLTGIRLHDFNCGLKAYKKAVIEDINVYGELHRYIPAIAHWKGFSVGEIIVQHHPRKYGKSKYGMGRFWKGLLDLTTMLFTTRYMQRPLHLFGFWGLIFSLAGFLINSWLVVEWMMGLTALGNRPLFLAGVLLMIVGVQFISIGLIGEMITKTQESKKEYSIKEIWK